MTDDSNDLQDSEIGKNPSWDYWADPVFLSGAVLLIVGFFNPPFFGVGAALLILAYSLRHRTAARAAKRRRALDLENSPGE